MGSKTNIDKTNPFWKWHRPSKETKKDFKKKTSMVPDEIGLPTDEYFTLLERIYGVETKPYGKEKEFLKALKILAYNGGVALAETKSQILGKNTTKP